MLTNAEFVKVLQKAYSNKIYGMELTMLIAILNNCNDKGECRKSNQDYSKQLGASARSKSGWISELRNQGAIGICINSHSHVRIIYIKGIAVYHQPETIEDMSLGQRMFHEMFPNKRLDCEIPDDVDMLGLMAKIRESTWLRNSAENMTLKSFVKTCYKRIMNNEFSDDAMRRKFGYLGSRNYSDAEMNSLFQNVDEIEI